MKHTSSLLPADERSLMAMRAMAERVIPSLEWRWHGIGCLQAYISESEYGPEYRLHIWHDDLVLPGIRGHGDVHNHRFELTSTVLAGSICHQELWPEEHKLGDWGMWDFVHARKQQAKDKTFEGMRRVGGTYRVGFSEELSYASGGRYRFEPGAFHRTRLSPFFDVAVTLCEKRAQQDVRAKVLAPLESDPVPAFSGNLTEELLEKVCFDAMTELSR